MWESQAAFWPGFSGIFTAGPRHAFSSCQLFTAASLAGRRCEQFSLQPFELSFQLCRIEQVVTLSQLLPGAFVNET